MVKTLTEYGQGQRIMITSTVPSGSLIDHFKKSANVLIKMTQGIVVRRWTRHVDN